MCVCVCVCVCLLALACACMYLCVCACGLLSDPHTNIRNCLNIHALMWPLLMSIVSG